MALQLGATYAEYTLALFIMLNVYLTMDHIHVVRLIWEKCYEFGMELHNIFIDFKQAFDKVNRPKMCETLKLLRIPTKLIRLVKTTLRNSRAVVDIYR